MQAKLVCYAIRNKNMTIVHFLLSSCDVVTWKAGGRRVVLAFWSKVVEWDLQSITDENIVGCIHSTTETQSNMIVDFFSRTFDNL